MNKEKFRPTGVLEKVHDKLREKCRNDCGRFSYHPKHGLCYKCYRRLKGNNKEFFQKKVYDVPFNRSYSQKIGILKNYLKIKRKIDEDKK